uniref:Transmembrane transport n=1 Tax=Macrostomum lignano TaxID=282301 RepID=A0A1I8FKP0_9PLAT
MTHNEKRAHWLKEGGIGLGVGILYGVTNVVVGHPFDTMKTKMQAQRGFDTGGMLKAFSKNLAGCIPPLWGSGIFRSTQFAVFESVYTGLSSSLFIEPIPFTGGVQGSETQQPTTTPSEDPQHCIR